MKLKFYVYFIFSLLISVTSYANEFTCNDLKNSIINNPILNQPLKDEVNDFGFSFFGYSNEQDNFIFETQEANGEGIIIKKLFNQTFNENFHFKDEDNFTYPLDLITKINSINVKELFLSTTIEDASLQINNLLENEDFLNIEVQNSVYKNFNKKIDIYKEVYTKPITVWIDFKLEDITFIDVKNNTYNSKYAFPSEWKDNRWKENLNKVHKKKCKFKNIKENDVFYKSFWKPEIISENKIENIDSFDNFQYANIFIYLYEDGNTYVSIEKINNAMFNISFDLRENFLLTDNLLFIVFIHQN